MMKQYNMNISKLRQKLLHSSIYPLVILFLSSCGPTIPIKFPTYPETTGAQLRKLLRGKRNLGIVAAKPRQNMLQRIGYQDDWSATAEAAVAAAFTEKGYFTVVDIENRKDRLRELAHSQSGLTRESLKIGKELSIQNMLIIRMTNQPRSQCRTKMVADYAGAALQMAIAAATDSGEKPQLKKATKVMYLTVFVEGKLINVETGQTVRYANSKAHEYYNSVGDMNCPSSLAAFDPALKKAADVIASNLSPKVTTLQVPLMDTAGDSRGDAARVEKFLGDGNTWAEGEDFQAASKSWQRALSESGGTSMSAMWNLGVYNWYKGDYSAANRYFEKVKGELGPGGLSSSMMLLMSKFREQKNEKKGRR